MELDDPHDTARTAAERARVTVVDGRALDRDGLAALADPLGRVWGRGRGLGPSRRSRGPRRPA